MSRWLWIVLVIVCVAALVRCAGLGRESLWTDEMHTVRFSGVRFMPQQPPWQVSDLRQVTQGPLFMLMVHGWWKLVGTNDGALRILPALFGLAAVPCVMGLGRRLFGRWVGIGAGLLVALSPFHVWYSRELRGYTLVVLAAVVATWLLSIVLERLARRQPFVTHLGFYVLSTIVGVGASFTMLFVLVMHALVALVTLVRMGAGRRVWIAVCGAVLVSIIVGWPWLEAMSSKLDWGRLFGFGQSEEALRSAPAMPRGSLPYTFFTFAAGFSLGPTLAELHGATLAEALRAHMGTIVLVVLTFGVPFVYGAWRLLRDRHAQALLLAAWMVVPVILAAVLAVAEVKAWNPRYVMVALPAFFYVIAFGARALPGRGAVLVAPLMVAIFGLVNLHTDPRYFKEDYRGAAAYLDGRLEGADGMVSEGAPQPLFFYLGWQPAAYIHIQTHRYSPDEAARRLDAALGPAPRVWHLRARAWQGDPAAISGYLGGGRGAVEGVAFRGITIERFDRRP